MSRGTETANDFANRFLWCVCSTDKEKPDGNPHALDAFVEPLTALLAKGKAIGEMTSEASARLWKGVYGGLKRVDDIGAERARAQALRLSMLYAIMNGSSVIEEAHLKAALALWDYCEASARECFGTTAHTTQTQPTSDFDKILALITSNPGITKRAIQRAIRRMKDPILTPILASLVEQGRAYSVSVESRRGGLPSEQWFAARWDIWTVGQSANGGNGSTVPSSHRPNVPQAPQVADVVFEAVADGPLEEGEREAGLSHVGDVITAVRESGGRFVWIGGCVAVVPSPEPSIMRAIAFHQSALRELMPKTA